MHYRMIGRRKLKVAVRNFGDIKSQGTINFYKINKCQ